MRNPVLSTLAAVVSLALLCGCATQQGGNGGQEPDASAAPSASSAVDLVDLWRVGGAEGESDNTWLRLEASEFQLWRECGVVFGSWRVHGGLLLAGVYGASGDCATSSVPEAQWLDAVSGYSATGDGFDLVDEDGSTVASLTIDGTPEPRADLAESYTEPPEVTAEVMEALADPVPLRADLVPIVREELVGRWTPVGPAAATEAHVEFTGDGGWSGSDGCNGGAGRWAMGERGVFLATSGASTLMACDGAAVPAWVAGATTVGLDRGELVLTGADGTELGRATRS